VKTEKDRPRADASLVYRYRMTAVLKEDKSRIDAALRTKGRFFIIYLI
jgi:hypothetical protein